MKTLHAQEIEQLKRLFSQEGVDRFEDRLEVIDAFLQTDHHITAGELHEHLLERGISLEADFVRDTLKLMSRFGFAQGNRFGNGAVRYEHLHLGHHHDHMVCTKCRRIFEFKNESLEALQIQVAREHGFHLLQHRMELYGICRDCLDVPVDRMPLVAARPGERLIIQEFCGGSRARMRLLTMGLRPGDPIEVITSLQEGQIAIAADNRRFVLGRGLAQKILVQPDRQQPGRVLSHSADEET